MKQYHFTKEGFENLKKEQVDLKEARKHAVFDLKKAREMGDLSENGYYKAAKMKLGQIDHRLFRIAVFLRYGKVIEKKDSSTVQLGSTVTLFDGKETVTYQIVGSEEADPGKGRVSNISPLGKALIGRKRGDTFAVNNTSYSVKSLL